MEYNTQRKKLKITDYGRNVCKLIEFAKTIENREKRNQVANIIINVMSQVNPNAQDNIDYKHKLWDHLAIMSDFKLDIDAPYELPEREILHKSPEKIPYSSGTIRARHYGKSVEKLVEKIKETTDPEQRRALIALTANHMKKSYLTWNRDSVEDNQIISDINEMYGEELIPMEGVMLSNQKELLQRKNNNGKNNHSRQQRKGGNGMQYRRKQ